MQKFHLEFFGTERIQRKLFKWPICKQEVLHHTFKINIQMQSECENLPGHFKIKDFLLMGLKLFSGIYRRVSCRMAWLMFFHMYMSWFVVSGAIVCCARKISNLCVLFFMILVDPEHWLFRKHKHEEHACLEASLVREERPPWSRSLVFQQSCCIFRLASLGGRCLEGGPPPSAHRFRLLPRSSTSKARFACAPSGTERCLFFCSGGLLLTHLLILFAAVTAVVSPAVPPFDQHSNWTCFVFVSESLRPDRCYHFLPCCGDTFHAVFPWFLVVRSDFLFIC